MIQRSLRTLCGVFCQSFKNDVGSSVQEQGSMNTNKLIFIMMTKPDSNTGACGGEVVSFSTKKKTSMLASRRCYLSRLVQDSSHLAASLPASLISCSGCKPQLRRAGQTPPRRKKNHSQNSAVTHVTHWLHIFQFKRAQFQSEPSRSLWIE